eukprot:2636374-Rhodomonas_salina.1
MSAYTRAHTHTHLRNATSQVQVRASRQTDRCWSRVLAVRGTELEYGAGQILAELMGWGRVKETDTDVGVKVLVCVCVCGVTLCVCDMTFSVCVVTFSACDVTLCVCDVTLCLCLPVLGRTGIEAGYVQLSPEVQGHEVPFASCVVCDARTKLAGYRDTHRLSRQNLLGYNLATHWLSNDFLGAFDDDVDNADDDDRDDDDDDDEKEGGGGGR